MADLSFREVERFLTDLSALIRSGVPVPEGLTRLGAEAGSRSLRKLSHEVASATAQGKSLAEALEGASVRVPKGLIALFRNAESVGSATGTLLAFTASHARRLGQHRSHLVTVMFYPWVVAIALVIVVCFLAYSVIPRYEDIFKQLGAELPLLTQLVVDISMAVRTNLFLQAAVLLLVAGMVSLGFSERMRNILFARLSGIPGYAGLVALSDAAIVMKYLGVMLGKGLPLPDALRSISLSVALDSTRDSLEDMAAAADKGQPTAPHLNPAFPATVVYLYQQGETTGRLPEVCDNLGDWADQSFEQQGRRVAGFAEPAMLLIVFVCIAILLISLYLPLFAIPKLVGR